MEGARAGVWVGATRPISSHRDLSLAAWGFTGERDVRIACPTARKVGVDAGRDNVGTVGPGVGASDVTVVVVIVVIVAVAHGGADLGRLGMSTDADCECVSALSVVALRPNEKPSRLADLLRGLLSWPWP